MKATNISKPLAILLAASMMLPAGQLACLSVSAQETPVTKSPASGSGSLNYSFTGDDQRKAGYAEGTLTLRADTSGTYKLYWANDTAALDGYYPIGELELSSGGSGSISLGNHTVIPAGVTKVIAVSSDSHAVADAYATFDIPTAKQLSSASGQLLYTFSTYSDVHIDKGSKYYSMADERWQQGLSYSTKRAADYIIVSGDCVTNDSGPDKEWDAYNKLLSKSDYVNPVWESGGNHDLRQEVVSGLKSFIKGTGTDDSKSGKPYFYKIEEKTGDLFIFMALDVDKDVNTHNAFTDEQLTWVQELLAQNYGSRNIFLVQHAPVKRFGAGDRMTDPYYGGLMNTNYPNNEAFKQLLLQYPDIVFLSGHTHEDFVMDYNYSNENGTAANMIHTPSLAGSTMPKENNVELERNNGLGFHSQGYFTEVYQNEIVFYGANIEEEMMYPLYSYIMEGSRTDSTAVNQPTPARPLTGTVVDISKTVSTVSTVLSRYYKYASYDSYQALKKWYYQHKEETTADESVLQEEQELIQALSVHTGEIHVYPLRDTYYFVNNYNWSSVYAYAWNSDGNNAEWPGVKLTKYGSNDYGEDIYKVQFASAGQYNNLIFNGGSNTNQTVNISLEQYAYDSFYISGSDNGKYTVANFDSQAVPQQQIALLYYITDEHGWESTDTTFTMGEDGLYRTSVNANSTNTFSLSLYNMTTKKYYTLTDSIKMDFALGQSFTYTLEEKSSRGKSISIYGLTSDYRLMFAFNPDTLQITITCTTIAPVQELVNESTISASKVNVGDIVTLTGAATGGLGEHSFRYYYKKSTSAAWTEIQPTNGIASFKPIAEAVYKAKVVVTDAAGTETAKTFRVTAVKPQALTNTSTVSTDTAYIGTTVTLAGAAQGGASPYTYQYYYKKSTSSKWIELSANGQEASFKPAAEALYQAKVVVTDSRGAKAVKTFSVNAVRLPALENTSEISTLTPFVGESVVLTGSAAGGAEPYTFRFYFKKSSGNSWTKLDSEDGLTASFKPGMQTEYDAKVVVTDQTGRSAVKTFTVSATKADPLVNESQLSAGDAFVKTVITVTGDASGGASPYTYRFYYKKVTSSNWTELHSADGSTATFKVLAAVDYQVKVIVTDSIGKSAVKLLNLTVIPMA